MEGKVPLGRSGDSHSCSQQHAVMPSEPHACSGLGFPFCYTRTCASLEDQRPRPSAIYFQRISFGVSFLYGIRIRLCYSRRFQVIMASGSVSAYVRVRRGSARALWDFQHQKALDPSLFLILCVVFPSCGNSVVQDGCRYTVLCLKN